MPNRAFTSDAHGEGSDTFLLLGRLSPPHSRFRTVCMTQYHRKTSFLTLCIAQDHRRKSAPKDKSECQHFHVNKIRPTDSERQKRPDLRGAGP